MAGGGGRRAGTVDVVRRPRSRLRLRPGRHRPAGVVRPGRGGARRARRRPEALGAGRRGGLVPPGRWAGGRRALASAVRTPAGAGAPRSEEHTSELQSPCNLVCRLLLEKKKKKIMSDTRADQKIATMYI